MAYDPDTQFTGIAQPMRYNAGEKAFATTDLTVEVETDLGFVQMALATPKAATGDLVETLYCDRTVTGGKVTVTREVKPYTLRAVADDAVHIDSGGFNWEDVPIGYVPWAGTISRVTIYNVTKAGGAPKVLLGNILAAGTNDPDDHITATAAVATPADGAYTNITLAAKFDGTAGQSVAAGDLLIFGTSGGADTAPSGLMVEVEITPTPTSGLTFNYLFFGT